jgi:P-type Cu2+ transporter
MKMDTLTQQRQNPASSNKEKSLGNITLPVTGMSCAGCASSVESILSSQQGVKKASVNFATHQVSVEYDPELITLSQMQQATQSVGFDLIIDQENASEKQEGLQLQQYGILKSKTIWASIFALPVVIIGMFFMDLPYGNWAMLFLTIPVIWMGRNFYTGALKQARHGKANMDTLVALSTGIAFLFSTFNTLYPEFLHSRGIHPHVYFEAAAVIIAFILLGKLLEEKAKSNTSSAIKKLMGLQPKTVRVMENNQEREIPIAQVIKGHTIIIRPGERVPVDGEVTEGNSYVDESMISGEPVPVAKTKGEKVFAGTINQKGSFQFKAEKVGGETILAQIIQMVQQAQGSKAPVQKLVDKIAGIFVPIVIAIAILSFMVWIILGTENAFTHALLALITVLVIACPCALGLATPTAIMVGVGKGAENNILIKDAESLELGHKVNAVVLDKTGTITEGKPEVTSLTWVSNIAETSLLQSILLAVEKHSEHPLAEAVVRYLQTKDHLAVSLENFESITGKGVKANCQGKHYVVGNASLLQEFDLKISHSIKEQSQSLQEKAETVVYFADSERVLALISITDKIKPTSKEAIRTLQNKGIEVYMLTGDNPHTAQAIAQQVGLQHYKAEVMPADKAAFVTALQKQGKIVAMVGDGINDSHALAQADVSIAMGKGSDIAMDVAKITLITSDLNMVPKALKLSAKTVNAIRQNLFWAFIYNVIGIPVAAGLLYPFTGFLLDPMLAGAAMALSSVSVVSNSLRLKKAKI